MGATKKVQEKKSVKGFMWEEEKYVIQDRIKIAGSPCVQDLEQ